jgi:hypothetical protein
VRGFRLDGASEHRAGTTSRARRDSLGLPRPIDDEWQRVQERIDGIVHRQDDGANREPRRDECARTRRARSGANEGESR